MNPTLSVAEVDALLEVLGRGLVSIRMFAASGDAAKAEAIADALHNAPQLLREGHTLGWSVAGFEEIFLAGLFERYPDLAGLAQPLDDVRLRR